MQVALLRCDRHPDPYSDSKWLCPQGLLHGSPKEFRATPFEVLSSPAVAARQVVFREREVIPSPLLH